MNEYKLYGIITPKNKTNKLLKLAFKNQMPGATILPGSGTYESKFLKFLGLDNYEKEIILLISPSPLGDEVIGIIKNEMDFTSKNSGIIFSLPVSELYGIHIQNNYDFKEGVNKMNKKLIFTVVNKDMGNDVIDIANSLGAKGATIMNGRGGGNLSAMKLFNLEIEPQKDIVLIITDNNTKNNIIEALKEKLAINEPNKGIIFVLDLAETYGLIE